MMKQRYISAASHRRRLIQKDLPLFRGAERVIDRIERVRIAYPFGKCELDSARVHCDFDPHTRVLTARVIDVPQKAPWA